APEEGDAGLPLGPTSALPSHLTRDRGRVRSVPVALATARRPRAACVRRPDPVVLAGQGVEAGTGVPARPCVRVRVLHDAPVLDRGAHRAGMAGALSRVGRLLWRVRAGGED